MWWMILGYFYFFGEHANFRRVWLEQIRQFYAIFKLHFLKTAQIKFQVKLVLAQSIYNRLMFSKFLIGTSESFCKIDHVCPPRSVK